MKLIISILLLSSLLSANKIEESFNKLKTEEMAKVLAKIIGSALPKRLDEITVVKSTYYEAKMYGIKKYIIPKNNKIKEAFKPYLVPKLYEKQSFYEYMKNSEIKNMCKSRVIRLFLNKNGIVKIDYYNQEEENILYILLNKEDCK